MHGPMLISRPRGGSAMAIEDFGITGTEGTEAKGHREIHENRSSSNIDSNNIFLILGHSGLASAGELQTFREEKRSTKLTRDLFALVSHVQTSCLKTLLQDFHWRNVNSFEISAF
uniref:Uncharacterized protein n=1 Tax=Glossina palpalis gambiensis TaxID=67801 RepID=A0A1B0AP07_9MUSC